PFDIAERQRSVTMNVTLSRIDDTLRTLAHEATASPGRSDAPSDPALARLRALGTELWMDTGDQEEAGRLWRREFSAFTVNNTLANQVVQTGRMDTIIREAAKDLRDANPRISDQEWIMELGFV